MKKSIEWSDLELKKVLGEGQAGRVWLAQVKVAVRDYPAGSYVAVKSYKSWLLEQPGQFERIIRELELGRRIQHPTLVKTISIIRDDEGKPALVMDYYPGETLEAYLENKRLQELPIDTESAFAILRDLASSINALHQAGAIHRDIKPANVILSDNRAILMDLGVISSGDFPEQTTSGAFLGTIRYAAPEYLFGETYDDRVDVYSLGAIAYELFFGKRFLRSDNQWAKLIISKASFREREFEDYRELSRRFGMNTAAFLSFLFKLALANAERRTLNLNDLSRWIETRVWERPFHVRSTELIEGEPVGSAFGESETNSERTLSLSDLNKQLTERLSIEDRNDLCSKLDDHFWSGDTERSEYGDERIERLVKAGILTFSGGDSGDVWYRYHESVLMLRRYGYL